MLSRKFLLTATVALACTTGVAKADSITLELSTHSSDATPAGYLMATFTFDVSALGYHLDLTVTNNTGPNTFDINEIYFNAPGDLILTEVTHVDPDIPLSGWGSVSSGAADGFGVFDFSITDVSGNPNVIAPGVSLTFHFDISNGTATAADFGTEFSEIPPGERNAIIGAKFIHGPDDPESKGNEDSAYGVYVPLPPALPMGIAGLIGVAFLRRRTLKK